MSNGDVWGTTSITVARSSEGAREARRCVPCNQVFSRPQETDLTHRQVVETAECPVDAEVTTVTPAGRWRRR